MSDPRSPAIGSEPLIPALSFFAFEVPGTLAGHCGTISLNNVEQIDVLTNPETRMNIVLTCFGFIQ